MDVSYSSKMNIGSQQSTATDCCCGFDILVPEMCSADRKTSPKNSDFIFSSTAGSLSLKSLRFLGAQMCMKVSRSSKINIGSQQFTATECCCGFDILAPEMFSADRKTSSENFNFIFSSTNGSFSLKLLQLLGAEMCMRVSHSSKMNISSQ